MSGAMRIGKHLQALMANKGIAAESVRRRMGWDEKTLENVLNDAVSPGVSELLALAGLLGVDIAGLLYGREYQQRKAVKTAGNERVGVDRKDYLHYESLAPAYVGRHLEPFVVDIYHKQEAELEVSRHPGEEFFYVLSGHIRATVDGEVYDLEAGDSFYFDSMQQHTVNSVTEQSRIVAVVYNRESLVHFTKGKGMQGLIAAAKMLPRRNLVLVCPDRTSLGAANKALEERIIETVYLVGSKTKIETLCGSELLFPQQYQYVDVTAQGDGYAVAAARAGVALIREGKGQMLMKGELNTADFARAILNRENGIGVGRRLSLVSLFEIPGVERLLFLTDPGINPELFAGGDVTAGVEIIENALGVARSMGVEQPKVALLEANEVPTEKIPTTLMEKALAERQWQGADVYGPLSYDLALYPDAAKKKGMQDNPVAGQADILVVPTLAGGNILYKTWVFTMGAEVANVVLGATVPIILTSRSDSDVTKFLTICASAIYSNYLLQGR